jgi:hypothetical protein
MNGRGKTTYTILFRELEGKRPHGRPRCRWGDNIGMDLGELGWEAVDWILLVQVRTNGGLL